jgi:hypothetical protein
MKSLRTIVPGALAAAAALALIGAGPAQAEVRTGWIGPTPAVNGTLYLHTSTIDNGGVPIASTRIYTAFGAVVSPGIMGSKARLFREGALCSATDYRFNAFITNSQNASTQRDCGAGFYNSHGFVGVYNQTNNAVSEYVTFPTDPLQYPAPSASARQSQTAPEVGESGVNAKGESYGDGLNAQTDAELPDLVSAIGTDLQPGFIRATDLAVAPSVDAPATRTVPLLSVDGETIGEFRIGG